MFTYTSSNKLQIAFQNSKNGMHYLLLKFTQVRPIASNTRILQKTRDIVRVVLNLISILKFLGEHTYTQSIEKSFGFNNLLTNDIHLLLEKKLKMNIDLKVKVAKFSYSVSMMCKLTFPLLFPFIVFMEPNYVHLFLKSS